MIRQEKARGFLSLAAVTLFFMSVLGLVKQAGMDTQLRAVPKVATGPGVDELYRVGTIQHNSVMESVFQNELHEREVAAKNYRDAVARQARIDAAKRAAKRGNRGGGSRGNWGSCSLDYIRAHENHGDYGRSTNPTHFGAYQFDRGTWASNGGDPNHWGNASKEEQDQVAATTYARRGSQPWAVCH